MLTKYQVKGTFSLLSTTSSLQATPAYVYKDGKKTDQVRTWRGQPIYRLRGALPLIDGEVVPDGFIYVTSENVPTVSVAQVLTLEGEISLRAARGFGLTCSLVGSLTSENEDFSLEMGGMTDE